eukprot:364169-Chlamydomonas_euryale.AAC.2
MQYAGRGLWLPVHLTGLRCTWQAGGAPGRLEVQLAALRCTWQARGAPGWLEVHLAGSGGGSEVAAAVREASMHDSAPTGGCGRRRCVSRS